jgi:putative AlgH/UPF0301 family transcriptional regulator
MRKRTLVIFAGTMMAPEQLLFLRSVAGFSVALTSPPHCCRGITKQLTCSRSVVTKLLSGGGNESGDLDDDDDEEEGIALEDDDWRSFRAKLVMGESSKSSTVSSPQPPSSTPAVEDDLDGIGAIFADDDFGSVDQEINVSTLSQGMTPLDPSQWAYDSGKVIEQGAVILGGVEQDYGFGLRQQYFHKAAILVLEHEEKTFTKGIILNRPTDLMLEDESDPDIKWRVWFGGDVQGIGSNSPSIVCLHSIKSKRAVDASRSVMKDIQWTTLENASKLVRSREATPSDFWVFVGYAGWGPGQLMGELDRQSWYMVATDSQTLLKELARLRTVVEPRDAGLETWDLLMNMIGRQQTAKEKSGTFDDLMLKEWALQNLLSSEAGGGAGSQKRLPSELVGSDFNVAMRLLQRKRSFEIGSVLRASSANRSPFLLQDQELHKSLILIIADDENLSVGAILSRPVSRGLDISISDNGSGRSQKIVLPLRYGGKYSIKGDEALLWLHCSHPLRRAGIGSPVGMNKNGVWKCTSEDVVSAITRGLATPKDFFVVTGVCVWTKIGPTQGIEGEIEDGSYEVVPNENIESIWKSLAKQEVLSETNLELNLAAAEEAWNRGGDGLPLAKKLDDSKPLGGLGEGFDEEDDTLVFKSDVKVADLSDDALKTWVSVFLLGTPFSNDDDTD